MKTVIKMLIT